MGTKPLFISSPRGDKSQFDDFWKIKRSELKDFVEYQKKWLRDNGEKYRLQILRSCQMKAEREARYAERKVGI